MNIGAHRNTEWTKKHAIERIKIKYNQRRYGTLLQIFGQVEVFHRDLFVFSFIIEKELHYHRAGAPCFEFWNVCSCDDQSKIWTLWIKMNRQLTKIIIDQYWLIQKTVFRMVMYCGMPGALVRTLNFHVWNRSHEISIKCIRNRGEKKFKTKWMIKWSSQFSYRLSCHAKLRIKKKQQSSCKTKITRIVWVLRRTCMILISILNSKYWANSIKPGGRLNEQNKKPNSMIRILSGWARNA